MFLNLLGNNCCFLGSNAWMFLHQLTFLRVGKGETNNRKICFRTIVLLIWPVQQVFVGGRECCRRESEARLQQKPVIQSSATAKMFSGRCPDLEAKYGRHKCIFSLTSHGEKQTNSRM